MNDEKFQYKLPEVRVRLAEGAALYSSSSINSPEDAVHCMAGMLAELDREFLCVVNMDTKGHPLNYNIVSIGGIDTVQVPMMNVFKTAILSNASEIMLLHNHPSGDIQPSQLDITVTQKVYAASQLMDIKLIDHIIVGGGTGAYYSMLENGLYDTITQTEAAAEVRNIRGMTTGAKSRPEETVDIFDKTVKKTRKHHRSR